MTDLYAKMKQHYENSANVEHYAHNRFSGKRKRTHRKEAKITERFFRKNIGPVETILDLPCGAGRFQEQLLRHTKHLVEMDYSTTMLRKARQMMMTQFAPEDQIRIRFEEGSIFEIPFADNSFDVVFAMRIYHHYGELDRAKILQELKRVSRKWIILSFFNARSYQHLRRIIKFKLGKSKARRIAITIGQFNSEVKGAGLRLCDLHSNARFFSEQTLALLEVL